MAAPSFSFSACFSSFSISLSNDFFFSTTSVRVVYPDLIGAISVFNPYLLNSLTP